MDRTIAGVYNDIGRFVRFKCDPVKSRLVGEGIFCLHAVVVQVHFIRVRREVLIIVVVGNDRPQFFPLIGTKVERGTFPVIGDNQWQSV